MTFDFGKPGQVVIWMSDYVKNMSHDAPNDMDGKAATPAAAHLFKVYFHALGNAGTVPESEGVT